MLTDRGTEYCGKVDSHDYQLFLALNDIEHTKTKVKKPQSNGICERFHKTILDEFYTIAFRKKIYAGIAELQEDLHSWLDYYNRRRPHQGKRCVLKLQKPVSLTFHLHLRLRNCMVLGASELRGKFFKQKSNLNMQLGCKAQ